MIDVINLEKSFGNNKVLKGINITIEKVTLWLSSVLPVPVKVHS